MKQASDGERDWSRTVRKIAEDAAVALLWALLIVLVLVFAGGGSQFIYVDF